MSKLGRRPKLLALVLLGGPGLIAFDHFVLRGGGPSAALAQAATEAVVEHLTAGAEAESSKLSVPDLLRLTAEQSQSDTPALSRLFATVVAQEEVVETTSNDIVVTGVMVGSKRRAAVINGTVVRVGDAIGQSGWKVNSIDDEGVFLERNQERRRLTLNGGV